MRYYIFLLCLFTMFSCGEYQKVLKSDDFNLKFVKAVSYYENEDYNRALPLFSELSTIMLGTSKMEEVSYYFAYSNYAIGDYLLAANLFSRYVINYPKSDKSEECSYMSAYCFYVESPDYSLDPTNTYRAINRLQAFINKYPNSERIEECNKLIDELVSRLSAKSFEIAKQYYLTEDYKSAIISFDNLLIDYPSFENREEVYFLMVQSSYLLAVNSISTKIVNRLQETIDLYNQFKDNFNNSSYLSQLEYTHNQSIKMLEELKN